MTGGEGKLPVRLIIVIVAALAVAAAAIYFLVLRKPAEEVQINPVDRALQSATQTTLPTAPSPTEQLPEINPATKGNPFEGTYKNPFD